MHKLANILLLLVAIAFAGTLAAEQEYWEYTFRPGDSIWKIAQKYTTSVNNWARIQEINEIREGPDRRILPGTRILIPVSMLKLQPTPARVIAVRGGPGLVRANGDSAIVSVGARLYSGDRVITGRDQSLRMQFADQSELQVLPDSEVVLDKISHHKRTGMVDTRIRLNSGKVNTRVEKLGPDSSYEIRTPAAITAVRGTAYRLSVLDGGQISRTEVTAGLVGVTAGESSRDVPDGFGIVAEKDQPLPEPVKLLPAPEIGDNQSTDAAGLLVSWAMLDAAEHYRYQLARDDNFDETVIDSLTGDTSIAVNELEPGRYYLRIRGVDRFGLEGLDSTRDFVIDEPVAEVKDDHWQFIMMTGIMILIF